MGSGDWFKTIVSLKKLKGRRSKQAKDSLAVANANKNESVSLANGATSGMPVEDVAAIKVQTAFRAYRARKALRRLKGSVKLQVLIQGYAVKEQANASLNYLHKWSKIQAEIKTRRLYMVTEGKIRQKKLENQQKLEAKLHDIEVEWSSGSETMEEILARIYQREEAAVKRERAMAYALSHQWRANNSQSYGLGNSECGKADWGWSWKQYWIAARPWESHVPSKSISPQKAQSKQSSNTNKGKNNPPTPKSSASVKPPFSHGKGTATSRRLSFPAAEKPALCEESKNTSTTDSKK